MKNKKIGVIGMGMMGSAVISGAMAAGVVSKENVIVLEKDAERCDALKNKIGLTCASSVADIATCDAIIIAVKPQDMNPLLEELSHHITEDTVIVSVAAGVTVETLDTLLGKKGRIIRAMPNTPVLIGQGVTALCLGARATEEDMAYFQNLFQAIGATVVIKEDIFDVISALSGSGPAYFFYIVEAMVAAAAERGVDRATALALTIETAIGSMELLKASGKSPRDLTRDVTSPGGSTAEALASLDEAGIYTAFDDAIAAAVKRNKELGT
jgi:pyrroline-5-carboxylate reductase